MKPYGVKLSDSLRCDCRNGIKKTMCTCNTPSKRRNLVRSKLTQKRLARMFKRKARRDGSNNIARD